MIEIFVDGDGCPVKDVPGLLLTMSPTVQSFIRDSEVLLEEKRRGMIVTWAE